MAGRAPGAGSDHSHNVVPMPGGRPGIPDREHVQRTRERRLRIAMLAPPWIPVSPTGCGGIEFVVAMLSDALVEQGHDVELFCTPGLSSKAKLHRCSRRRIRRRSSGPCSRTTTSRPPSRRSTKRQGAHGRSTCSTFTAATRHWRWQAASPRRSFTPCTGHSTMTRARTTRGRALMRSWFFLGAQRWVVIQSRARRKRASRVFSG
jgi:hypothetical protein